MARRITVLYALAALFAFIKAEEGAECIFRCVMSNAEAGNATSRQERSVSHMVLAKRSVETLGAHLCSNNPMEKCVRACPRSKLDAIVRSINDIIAKHCDDNEATMNLAIGMRALRKIWVPQVDACVDNMTVTDMDELCTKSTACVFDSLEKLRAEFSDEVRTAGSGFFLLGFDTSILRHYGSDLPQTCDPLFDVDQRDKSVAKSAEPDISFGAKFRSFLGISQHGR